MLLINPVSYQDIGQQQGINHQDSYINFIADSIFTYLDSKDISHNIFIYREEYIAIIFEANSYKRHLNFICKLCRNLEFEIGQINYSCDVKVGIISPKSLEVQELEKSDFELMSIAMVLCNSVKSGEENQVCSYGDIKIEQQESTGEEQDYSSSLQLFNIENAIEEGRVSANYQPWVYIRSEEKADVKEIYDVRVELIDTRGNTVSQNLLLKLLDDAYAKRIVDKWVLRNVGNTIKELYSKNKDNTIKLAAKITLSSINDQAFIPWLRELLTEIDLPNDYLLIEIDATQLIRNPDAYQLLFNTVAVEFNIKFILSGIHNIGAYYDARIIHSFDYVKLNINQVLETDSRSSVQQLINEIRRDNVNVVAVNVSDAEMLALATEFDVDYMHGYLIGKPILDVLSDTHGDLYCVI